MKLHTHDEVSRYHRARQAARDYSEQYVSKAQRFLAWREQQPRPVVIKEGKY